LAFYFHILLIVNKKKIKVKAVAIHVVKAWRKIRGITPLFLKLSTRWRGVVKFIFRPLFLQERTPVLIE